TAAPGQPAGVQSARRPGWPVGHRRRRTYNLAALSLCAESGLAAALVALAAGAPGGGAADRRRRCPRHPRGGQPESDETTQPGRLSAGAGKTTAPLARRGGSRSVSALLIFDGVDVPHGGPRLGGDLGLVVHFLFQQRPGPRRVDGNVIPAGKDPVVADNAESELLALLTFDIHPGAEEHLALLLEPVVHYLEVFQAFAQIAHPAVDFAQALLVVLVIGIFTAVAQARRPGDLLGDIRALDPPELVQLPAQVFVALPGNQRRLQSLLLMSKSQPGRQRLTAAMGGGQVLTLAQRYDARRVDG